MTPYALLLRRCGLSHAEAAAWHAVSPDCVHSWASGRRTTRPEALAQLRALAAEIDAKAAAIRRGEQIEIAHLPPGAQFTVVALAAAQAG